MALENIPTIGPGALNANLDKVVVYKNGGSEAAVSLLTLTNSALSLSGVYLDPINGRVGIGVPNPTSALQVNGTTTSSNFFASGVIYGPSYWLESNGTMALGQQAAGSSKLFIKGSGSTSATSSLLVQNSSGNQLLKISDDGNYSFGINSVAQEFNFYGWNIVSLKINDAANGKTLSIYKNAGSNYLIDSNSDTRLSYGWGGNYFWRLNGQTKSMAMSSTVSDPTADVSSIVDFQSTTKGFLKPKMTTAQKNAIVTPAAGLEVYDTDLNRPCFYNGTSWITL